MAPAAVQTPVAEAERRLAAGDATGAVALITATSAAGDVDAIMRLATWRLIGDPLPRDLSAARALLRRAAEIGHVDAALMEVALTANGSGGPSNWPGARRLLTTAAAGDPIAAAQLVLIDAMRLDENGAPQIMPIGRVLAKSPDVRHFPSLLTRAECIHLAQLAGPLLMPATVVDPASGRLETHPVRTSADMVIGPTQENLVVRALNLRIASASGTDVARGEALTVLRYAPGQQYRPHHDALPNVTNQREWTMLVYLNDGYGGGETVFPHSRLRFKGKAGDGLLFRNTDKIGRPDSAAWHAGLPVSAGSKWLATRWIRQAPLDPWHIG